MKNYLPQRHKEENKKCTLLLTSTLFYEIYVVSITQKLREMHIKNQQGTKEITLGNVSLLGEERTNG